MAREGYLLDGEDPIHNPDAEIKANSPKSKWDNFWYYHKWHMIAGVIALCVVLFFVHDMTSRVNPDYQIALITKQTYPTDMVDALENQIAKYGKDLNGDGKVVVQVNTYTEAGDTSSSGMAVDPNVQMAGYVKLTSDISEGSSMIFITDDAAFRIEQKKMQIFSYLDGSTPASGAADYDKMRVSLQDSKMLENSKVVVADENLYISMRVFKGTQMESQKDKAAYYTASKKLFDEITKMK
jgi:hypothetical protein